MIGEWVVRQWKGVLLEVTAQNCLMYVTYKCSYIGSGLLYLQANFCVCLVLPCHTNNWICCSNIYFFILKNECIQIYLHVHAHVTQCCQVYRFIQNVHSVDCKKYRNSRDFLLAHLATGDCCGQSPFAHSDRQDIATVYMLLAIIRLYTIAALAGP